MYLYFCAKNGVHDLTELTRVQFRWLPPTLPKVAHDLAVRLNELITPSVDTQNRQLIDTSKPAIN